MRIFETKSFELLIIVFRNHKILSRFGPQTFVISDTPKTRYNDPSNKGILTIRKYFQSPSIFHTTPTVKSFSNNEPPYKEKLTITN
jgi:hypothetical protein